MLTQETQTENRLLIKQILTQINEAMAKQFEKKSLQMKKEEFDETVAQYKQAIQGVYDQNKKKSDTYFIEAGPSAEQIARNESHCDLHVHGNIGMSREQSNKDLINFVDHGVNT